MLSAIARRKDSTQSSEERLKQHACDHAPHTTSPPASSPIIDIVTNDDRAKSSTVVRVLSPMRPRRTPKLINAPAVQWRLALYQQHKPSLDSLLSSHSSASETSSLYSLPVVPQHVALPVSSASSSITTPPDTLPRDPPPLPPSPSPRATPTPSALAQRADARSGKTRGIPQWAPHQPHFLSPVIEATSAPSLRSSILDLAVQDVSTAERCLLTEFRQQNVQVVVTGRNGGPARQPRTRRRRRGESERVCSEEEERFRTPASKVQEVGTFRQQNVHVVAGRNGGPARQPRTRRRHRGESERVCSEGEERSSLSPASKVQDVGSERRPLADLRQQNVHVVAGRNGGSARQPRTRRRCRGKSERVCIEEEERFRASAFRVQDVGSERRPLTEFRQQDVHVVDAGKNDIASRASRMNERVCSEGEECPSPSRALKVHGGAFSSPADESEKMGARRVVGKLRKNARRAVGRAAGYLARKYVIRVLARLL